MLAPSVFVSCVSPEFRSARQLVSDVLLRLGFTPIKQEIFGTEAGDLRQVLRDKIDPCEGLIQLVGVAYGAEPKAETEFGRVSYTQFEYLYARAQGKKTWLVLVDENGLRDKPLDQLDLPHDPHHADPAAYQAERRDLQAKYRAARKHDVHLYHPIVNADQLLARVEQLRDELAVLRSEQRAWQADVSAKLTDITEQVRITTEKIKVHLLASAEQTYQKSLAEAEQAKGWQERQKRKDAAKEEHAARLARIDDLARSFAEIEGTADASDVFREMTRILAEEGVDEALAYIASRRGGILDLVKARTQAVHDRNRRDLRPLLKSAELLASRNEFAEAERVLTDVLQLEPHWGEARLQLGKMQIEQGRRAWSYQTTTRALAHFEAAKSTAEAILQRDPGNHDAESFLGAAWRQIGMIAKEQGNLTRACECFRHTLEIAQRLASVNPENAEWQRELSIILEKLGKAAMASGSLAEAREHHLGAFAVSERLALADSTNSEKQRDLSFGYHMLGEVAVKSGDLSGAKGYFTQSLTISQKLAADDPASADKQRDVYVSHYKLAAMSEKAGSPEAMTHWRAALDTLVRIQQQGLHVSPGDLDFLERLRRKVGG